jgi:hypothetical protein
MISVPSLKSGALPTCSSSSSATNVEWSHSHGKRRAELKTSESVCRGCGLRPPQSNEPRSVGKVTPLPIEIERRRWETATPTGRENARSTPLYARNKRGLAISERNLASLHVIETKRVI